MFSDMSQRNNEHGGIIVHEGLGQIFTHIGFSQQMVERIIGFGFGFYGLASQVFCQFFGLLDVSLLG
jgi:hypothetical protein